MKLYLLKRKDDYPADYEEYEGFVVQASGALEARQVATTYIRCASNFPEEEIVWTDANKSSVQLIGTSVGKRASVILAANRGA